MFVFYSSTRQQSSTVLRNVRLGQPLDAVLHRLSDKVQTLCQREPLLMIPSRNLHHDYIATLAREDTTRTISSPPSISILCRRERGLKPLQDIPLSRANQIRSLRKSVKKDSFAHLGKSSHQNSVMKKTKSDGMLCTSQLARHRNNAAQVIVRFFRSVCRIDDRVRKAFFQCLQEQRVERLQTSLFALTNDEQLRVLQLYNPHLYGPHQCKSPLALDPKSTSGTRVPQMERHKRLRQLEILTRMSVETERLNETARQKTRALINTTTTIQNAYQRYSPASQLRPKSVHSRQKPLIVRDQIKTARSSPARRFDPKPFSVHPTKACWQSEL